ncbi:MAG: ParB/RepB/Spo0J family partition protein [Rhodospirillales bacterium]|nr:MAG: ParB/RepB/Spo0J family partition protein [Rhodospirillales bacterium]
MTIETIPFSKLAPTEGANPRRSMDAAAIEGLAASIKADGLLQNLVVRRDGRKFRIVSGERRWRALALLVERGDIGKDYPVPVEVRADLTEADALRLATVENIQREQLPPMDEAEAFALLLGQGARLEDVAAKAGVSVLTVKRRVALASLTDEVKALVREGEISLAAAEALTLGSAEQQRAVIERLESGYRYDADDIRDWLTGEKPAVSLAIFPLERYEGTTTSDLFADEDSTVFDDAEQFLRLQTEAVEALAAHHREAGAAFVDILTDSYAAWWQYREAEQGETGGVVIHFKPSGRVEVREGLARREMRPSVAEDTADHPAAPKEKPEYTGAVIRMAAAHKSLAVMAGLLANPRKALEVAVVTMLNACDFTARMRLDAHPALGYFAGEDGKPETYAQVEGAAQGVMEALDIAATLTSRYPSPDRGAWETLLRPQKEPLALYEAVTALDDAALDALHLLLTTLTFGQGNMDALDAGASLFNRVASDLGVSMRDHWCPDEAFLSRRRKDQLEAIAKETGAVTRLGALKDYNKTQLAAALARHFERCAADDKLIAADLKARTNAWLPEAMRFGGSEAEGDDMAEVEEVAEVEADIEADDAIGDGFPTPAVEDVQTPHAA